ncbi:helix-turn-helix domain-containing protein [Nocardiopsis coralliicola]
MSDLPSQTVRHRRVSSELKSLRESAGRTTYEAADAMGWHRTKVHRIERGEWKRLREKDLRSLCAYYGVSDAARIDALIALARTASAKGWWSQYADVLGPGSYVQLEAQATSLRFYSGLLIPGLLQTHDYAEAIMRSGRITSQEEIERRLEARASRKLILSTPSPPDVRVILDEAALNKRIGSTLTMADQILAIIRSASRNEIQVGVAKDSLGVHTSLAGQFAILDFPGAHADSTVFIDNAHHGLFLEEEDEVYDYSHAFEGTWQVCTTGDAAIEFLRKKSEGFIAKEN